MSHWTDLQGVDGCGDGNSQAVAIDDGNVRSSFTVGTVSNGSIILRIVGSERIVNFSECFSSELFRCQSLK